MINDVIREDFWKLNQLDRMEYNLYRREIDEDNQATNTLEGMWMIIKAIFIVITLDLLMYIAMGEFVLMSNDLFQFFLQIGIAVFFVLGIVLDILVIMTKNKKIKEINERFFSFSTKPKRTKNK